MPARDLFRILVLSIAEAALKAAGLAGQPFAMIAPELSGIPEALAKAIRRRSRRGLS